MQQVTIQIDTVYTRSFSESEMWGSRPFFSVFYDVFFLSPFPLTRESPPSTISQLVGLRARARVAAAG